MPLSKDATIASVAASLRRPEAYLCGVLQKFHDSRSPDAAVVRIGTTGRGSNPHYKIEFPPPDPFPVVFGSFRGDNHQPLVDDDLLRDGNWSSRTMDYTGVQALIGGAPPPEEGIVLPVGPKGQRRPADVVGNAVHVMRIATGEIEDTVPDDGKDPAAKALGKKGGAARAKAMSPERRAAIAKKAAATRWKRD